MIYLFSFVYPCFIRFAWQENYIATRTTTTNNKQHNEYSTMMRNNNNKIDRKYYTGVNNRELNVLILYYIHFIYNIYGML